MGLAPQTLSLPNPAVLDGVVSDDGLPNNTLTSVWSMVSGPAAVTFDNPNQAATAVSFTTAGTYVLQLSASDGALTSTAQVTITVNPNPTWETGWLATPLDKSTVTVPTDVTLVSGITLTSGTLKYYPASDQTAQVLLNAATTGTGKIGVFDPTGLANGAYWVELRATNTSGQTMTSLVLVNVAGEYKPGRVTATVTDLVVPAPGLAIRVDRTYDSLDRSRSMDFGYGWRLGLRLNMETSPTGHVTFTLNGRRRTFYFTPAGNPIFQYWFVPRYTGEPGFYGKLETTGDNCSGVLRRDGNQWACGVDNEGQKYAPAGYVYTDPGGRAYTIGADGSLQSVKDLNGNTLTVTAAGISSTSGLAVPFVRDGQGRITKITDPLGHEYIYAYNAAGELASVTYPSITTPAQYEYDTSHLLTRETDRRGNVAGTSTYYADGKLKSVTDALSNTTQYTYDTLTSTTTVTNSDGGKVVTVYDAGGYVLNVTDPLGHTTTNTYDANHNLLTTTNALGKVSTYTYNSKGFRTSTIDPLGNVSSTTYNDYGGPLTITDPLGQVRTQTYDSSYRPITLSDSLGQIGAVEYDLASNPTTVTNANGKQAKLAYDTYGNVTSTTDALGRSASATYDAIGHRLTMTDPLGNTTTYTYDQLGQLTVVTNPDGTSASTTYDPNGNVISRTDAQGRTTTYTYDVAQRVVQTTYPDSTTSRTTYNWRGQPPAQTDALGRETTYSYDLAGQLLSTTTATGTADAATTSQTYDVVGRSLTSTDARGNSTTNAYDDAGRLLSVTNALNQTVTYTYDAAGRKIAAKDALGHRTQFAYDARSRLTTTTYPDNTTTTSTYDGVGHILTSTDQAGKVTTNTYSDVGQLTSILDALNQTTSYTYDANGNRRSKTDANSHMTTYTYDSLNRLETTTLPTGGLVASTTYNLSGSVASTTDFNGKTTSYSYDSMDRLLAITPDASLSETAITFTYTADGRRATMTDATGTTTYTYDHQGRLIAKATPQGTLSYTYDVAGNLLSMQSNHANGVSASYAYDVLNRLQSVTDTRLNGSTAYGYDAVGNVISTVYPNGVTAAPTFDVMNRVTSLAISKGSVLANYTYTYGAAGNKVSAAEASGRTSTFQYDAIYRLTQEAITGDTNAVNGTLGYLLDPVGNRLGLASTLTPVAPGTNTFDANDRATSDAYDNNGNTLTSGGKAYTYDFLNRLRSVNSGAVSMIYDGDGNRTSKTAGGVITQYLVDDLNPTGLPQVVEEIVVGVVQSSYAYGLTRISQNRVVNSAIVPSFYHYDGHGDVRLVTDSSDAVTDTYDYDAYGNLAHATGSTPNSFLYQGEQFDSETGLYYLRARYYNPSTGRFLTTDSAMSPGDNPTAAHAYLYTGGNPVDRNDPTGQFFETAIALQVANSIAKYVVKDATINNTYVTDMYSQIQRSFVCIMSKAASQLGLSVGLVSAGDCTTAAARFASGGDRGGSSCCGGSDESGPSSGSNPPQCDEKNIDEGRRSLKQLVGSKALNDSQIYRKYKGCIDRMIRNLQVKCDPDLKTPGGGVTCGFMGNGYEMHITVQGSKNCKPCGAVVNTMLHEIVHSCYNSDFGGKPLSMCDQEKEAFGIECQVFRDPMACTCARNPAKCGYACGR